MALILEVISNFFARAFFYQVSRTLIVIVFSLRKSMHWWWFYSCVCDKLQLKKKGSVFGLNLLLLYINDLPEGFFCNIAIYAFDTNLCFNFEWASDVMKQLELVSEL